jgi:hypothetical protein
MIKFIKVCHVGNHDYKVGDCKQFDTLKEQELIRNKVALPYVAEKKAEPPKVEKAVLPAAEEKAVK